MIEAAAAAISMEDTQGKFSINYDGSVHVSESWHNVMIAMTQVTADAQNTEETPEPSEVAREMIAGEWGEGAAIRAAQVLEERFQQWDLADAQRRREEFTAQVRNEFRAAMDERADNEGGTAGRVVVVWNLAEVVTVEILQGYYEQIGTVLSAGMEGSDWGWVEFELAAHAEEAISMFVGVELVGQAMGCAIMGVEEFRDGPEAEAQGGDGRCD